jgi:hypothetical protein
MSYPRFPAPFLDGLLDYLPLQTVLALTSVDRREAPGREHLINGALLNLDACVDREAFLTKYRCLVVASPATERDFVPMIDWSMFTRITELVFDEPVASLVALPPHLRHLAVLRVENCCVLPDSLTSLSIDYWPCAQNFFSHLTNLQMLASSTVMMEEPICWPTSLKSLTLSGEEELSSPDYIPGQITQLIIPGEWHMRRPLPDYSMFTELHELRLRTVHNSVLCIWEEIVFPPSLTRLEMGCYDCPVYPEGIISLASGFKWHDDMDHVVWPTALKELTLTSDYSGLIFQIPAGVTRLVFMYAYTRMGDYDETHGEDVNYSHLATIAEDSPRYLVSLELHSVPDAVAVPKRWPTTLRHFSVELPMTPQQLHLLLSRLPPYISHLRLRVLRLDRPLSAIKWPLGLQHLELKVDEPFQEELAMSRPSRLVTCIVTSR